MTINIFNKTTISCEDSPDPGPEARGGLRQGVPGKGPFSPPSSSGSDPWFCCEALHGPITLRRPTQNRPKGCSQVSWEAIPPCPTPPGGSP